MLVTLLFPLLLFVVVLVLFGLEDRFVPPNQVGRETRPDSLVGHQEEVEGSLPHYIHLWERIDSTVEEEQPGRSLRPVASSTEPRRLVAWPSAPSDGAASVDVRGGRRTRGRPPRRDRRTTLRRPAA